LTDGGDVNSGAIEVTDAYVWTGGRGGLMRWNRDDPNVQWKYTSESGLVENNVRDILADDETALWIATGSWPFYGDGWSRFTFVEGRQRWQTYTSGEGLRADGVFDFFWDSQGRLWAGARDGAWLYDEDRWTELEQLSDHWVSVIYEASDGAFWFELSGSDVVRYDPQVEDEAAWQRFDPREQLGSDKGGFNHVSSIIEGPPGVIWLGTNAGVVRYDGDTWQRGGGNLDVWTYAALRDLDGALWFGVDGSNYGLVRLAPDGEQHTYSTADGLTGDVKALRLDSAGVLWAAGEGLNQYDRENDRWQGYSAQNGLAHNHASAILQDLSGALWFGHSIFFTDAVGDDYTWSGGVSRFVSGDTPAWQYFDSGDGLNQSAVHVLYQDRDGILWFGFDRKGGGVCRYDLNEASWLDCFRADPDGLAADEVDAILQTRDGAMWFGTSGGGLSRRYGGRWETFTQDEEQLLSNEVHCLAEDADGALWITTDLGVNRFNYAEGNWSRFTTGASDLIADEVLAVAPDKHGGLWFGTTKGLSYWDGDKQDFRPNADGTPALPEWVTNCAQALHVDRFGMVWVGTDEGVFRSTPQGGWMRLTTANGLASNYVLAIFEDADGVLWVGTPSGVSRVSIGEQFIRR
jgi:ligand-binding sensor domain-containing protein